MKGVFILNHINRYIVKEIAPQFLSILILGLSLVTSLELVSLAKLLVSFGVSIENFLLPFLYILLPFLPTITPIAFFFGSMIGMSRLSGDGEVYAMMASGMSLFRIGAPFLYVAALVSVFTIASGFFIEPWARREFKAFLVEKAQAELDGLFRYKLQPGVFSSDFFGYVLFTEAISEDRSHYENVVLAPSQTGSRGDFVITAPHAFVKGSLEDGNLHMILQDGIVYSLPKASGRSSVIRFGRVDLNILKMFHEHILTAATAADDFRTFPVAKFSTYIEDLKKTKANDREYFKARYIWHWRFGQGLLVFSYTLLGMVYGLQQQRRGSQFGLFLLLVTLLLCFLTVEGGRWVAQTGLIHALLGVWLPHTMIFTFALYVFWRRNTLPLTDSIWPKFKKGDS